MLQALLCSQLDLLAFEWGEDDLDEVCCRDHLGCNLFGFSVLLFHCCKGDKQLNQASDLIKLYILLF